MITMRLLLAAALATGPVLAPAAGAEDTAKSAASKQKTNRAAKANENKAHKKMPRISSPAATTKTTDSPLGYPYTMQKDEMTR